MPEPRSLPLLQLFPAARNFGEVFRVIKSGLQVRISISYRLVGDHLGLEEEVFRLLGWRRSKIYGVVLEASSFGSAVCCRKKEGALIDGSASEGGRDQGAISGGLVGGCLQCGFFICACASNGDWHGSNEERESTCFGFC